MKKIKLLFQGDSITDAGRDYENYHDLGNGYPKYAAALLKERHPEIEFEFIDLGISGNQTKDLVERLEKDFVDIQPDIVSILIGINDVWHYASDRQWLDNVLFEERYRIILNSIKNRTNAKLMMIEPFLIPINDKNFFREDLNPKIDIIRQRQRILTACSDDTAIHIFDMFFGFFARFSKSFFCFLIYDFFGFFCHDFLSVVIARQLVSPNKLFNRVSLRLLHP